MNSTRLQRLVTEAFEHVPFYARHWKGVDVARLKLPEELHRLPLVSKADLLKCEPQERLDQRFLHSTMRSEPTSGSTGVPFEMRIDARSLMRRRMRFLFALMAVGYRLGHRLMLISDPPFPSGAHWVRWTYADLRRGEAEVFEMWLRTRPHVLYGPLSSLLLLARRVATSSGVQSLPSLVISTAEQLTPAHREYLARTFRARIADFYGMTELGLVAFSRDPGRYCIVPGQFHIEWVPAGEGTGLERLIVTDLGGGALPLIRFDTGDLVRRDFAQPGAPIVQISGRSADCVRLSNGRWLSPYEITLALDRVPGIRQYQVVQRADLGIDLFVSPAEFNAAAVLERARRAMAAICGDALRVNVYERAEQPLRPDQKQRVISSAAGAV